jgi:hypothetical protein
VKRIHTRTHPNVTITLTAPGQTVTGYVAVRAQDRQVALVRLVGGKARVVLANETWKTIRFRVVK